MNALEASPNQLPTLDQIRFEKASRHLKHFIPQAWPVVEPAREYLNNWHIDVIAEYLEAVSAGQILRLVLNMPPRSIKSTAVSVMWPVWTWSKKPSTRWLFASYSGSLSTMHSIARRRIIESYWYQERWGDVFKMTTDQNVKTEYENDKRGLMIATSMTGTATGKGGDIVVVDDPHKPTEVESDTEREKVIRDFDQTLSTRLDDKKRGAIVVVMQRLHERDLAEHCRELGYEMLVLQAEADKRTVITMPVSGRQIIREEGDILWPDREGRAELKVAQRALGSYGYAGQYQQDPSPTEGGMLKKWWWKFWHYADKPLDPVIMRKADGTEVECPVVPLPASFDEQVQSWDMTFKETKDSDYVAGQVWGHVGANSYLLDQVMERMDIVATLDAVRDLSKKWPRASSKLIEDKANGPAVIRMLQDTIGGLIAVEPEGGKVARVNAAVPFVEAGNVILPHPSIAPWVEGFIDRCAKFPKAANDDDVDTFTQAINRWSTNSVGVY